MRGTPLRQVVPVPLQLSPERSTSLFRPRQEKAQAPSLQTVRRLKPPAVGVETMSRSISSTCRPMPRTFPAFALILAAVHPTPLSGQGMVDLLQALRDGGTWVGIPIVDGVGRVGTVTLPTLGMTLRGCGQVYGAHTGRWTIHARDSLGGGRLDVEVVPGEPVEFSYTTGTLARLSVEARWSEARDTTLLVWIGLETRNPRSPDACVPVYGRGSGTPFPTTGNAAALLLGTTRPNRRSVPSPHGSGFDPGPDARRPPEDGGRGSRAGSNRDTPDMLRNEKPARSCRTKQGSHFTNGPG